MPQCSISKGSVIQTPCSTTNGKHFSASLSAHETPWSDCQCACITVFTPELVMAWTEIPLRKRAESEREREREGEKERERGEKEREWRESKKDKAKNIAKSCGLVNHMFKGKRVCPAKINKVFSCNWVASVTMLGGRGETEDG